MENKEQEKVSSEKKENENISSEKEINIDTNLYKVVTKDAEFEMTIRKLNNPVEVLEKFYLLRENDSLTSAEKNELAKKIMIDYMG